jgi:PKD domain
VISLQAARFLIGAACACALAALFSASASAAAITGLVRDLPSGRAASAAADAYAANVPYGGGTVLHSNRTHLIFWQPAGSGLTFEPGYEALIEGFLANVAAASHSTTSTYGLTGQYRDSSGPAAYDSVYAGAVVATDPLPSNECTEPAATGPGWTVCLTDSQLQAELEHVVAANHLPTQKRDIYFLLLPDGFGSCLDSSSTSCALGGSASGYCGYHSLTGNGRIRYAVIPYNAVQGHCQSDNPRPNNSTADPALSTISHEQIETITDPFGDAWIDASGNEIADLCITTFGPAIGGSGQGAWNEDINGGHYYLQEVWSNASHACEPRAKPDSASFTSALTGPPFWTLAFTARAADPEGRIVSYRWFFSRDQTGGGRTAYHRYRYAGNYRVLLRVTDSWDNWTFSARRVHVGKAV